MEAGSLIEKQLEIPNLTLTGVHLFIEIDGKGANYKAILENIKRFEASEASKPAPKSKKQTRQIHFREVVIRDIKITVKLRLMGRDLIDREFAIDELRLTDLTANQPGNWLIADMTSQVVRGVTAEGLQVIHERVPDTIKRRFEGMWDALSSEQTQ